MQSRLDFAAAMILVTLVMLGCDTVSRTSQLPPNSSAISGIRELISVDQSFRHDAGSVLAGQPIRHVFRYRNDDASELAVVADEGVQTSCGCTRVSLSRRRIAPGESTALALEVDTVGRVGEVAESATIVWQDARGHHRCCRFAVTAKVTSAFAFDPPELNFTKDDLRAGVTKEVCVTSRLHIDWRQVRLTSGTDYLGVSSCDVEGQSGGLTFQVHCAPTHTGETRRAAIRLSAVAPAEKLSGNGKAETPLADIESLTELHAELPIYSHDLARLRVAPRIPVLMPGTNQASWSGYMILTGDVIADGVRVKRIKARHGQVDFQTTALGKTAQRIDLTVKGNLDEITPGRRRLTLILDNGMEHSALVRLHGHQLSRSERTPQTD